ncbi:MAG TPA: hypothetical protein PKV21_08505 [bacterium]|nr:hypothetical protein [bacterium]
MGKFFPDGAIKKTSFVIRYTDDGVLLSDLHLTELVLSCVNGVKCQQAIKDDKSSRFLFKVEGNPEDIKKFIDGFFHGKTDFTEEEIKMKVMHFREFSSGLTYLKTLLDKARFTIEDERTPKQ